VQQALERTAAAVGEEAMREEGGEGVEVEWLNGRMEWMLASSRRRLAVKDGTAMAGNGLPA
jgi:hypothetical protein